MVGLLYLAVRCGVYLPAYPSMQYNPFTTPTGPNMTLVSGGESDPESTAFDYSELAEVDRQWLSNAAADLRASLRRSVDAVIDAGRKLSYARNRLGRGKWEPWLEQEAQIPRRSASRLIAVHKVFKTCDPNTLQKFTPTALYVLAEPGVPQSIREYAVEQADDGAGVTAALVHQWVSLYRQQVEPTRREVVKLAPLDDKIKEEFDADEVNAPANWRLLLKIFGEDNSLYIQRATDVENGDRIISGAVVGGGGRKTATGKTLEAVVLELAGERRVKPCKKCKEVKALDKFSRRADSDDGRNHYCLECERKRVQAYERLKASRNAASASGTT